MLESLCEYVYLGKVELLFFVFQPNFLFVYSGLTKVRRDFLLSFFFTENTHACERLKAAVCQSALDWAQIFI